MQQPALQKVRDWQGHLLDPRTRALSLLMTGATGEGDAGAVVCHQAAVLDGTAPEIAGQIHHHSGPVGIAFQDTHIPARLRRMPRRFKRLMNCCGRIGSGRTNAPRAEACRIAASSLPRNIAITTRAGSRKPLWTAFQAPSGVRPPPVTRQCTCGCSTKVWLQVWSAAMMPGCAPRYVGSASKVRSVSWTA